MAFISLKTISSSSKTSLALFVLSKSVGFHRLPTELPVHTTSRTPFLPLVCSLPAFPRFSYGNIRQQRGKQQASFCLHTIKGLTSKSKDLHCIIHVILNAPYIFTSAHCKHAVFKSRSGHHLRSAQKWPPPAGTAMTSRCPSRMLGALCGGEGGGAERSPTIARTSFFGVIWTWKKSYFIR